ncbi:male-specific lethal 2 [Sarotherodon galilaeus]
MGTGDSCWRVLKLVENLAKNTYGPITPWTTGAYTKDLEHWVMPVIQKPAGKMFFENANLQQQRRHHKFFLRSRPYRGEPPTVAGFLLYPNTPAKMETTSREAFCFRPIPDQDPGKAGRNTQQESHHSPPASSRKTGRGNRREDREVRGNEQEGNSDHTSAAAKNEQETAQMQSQYQKDFPPPSSCHRRRTPAFPQPDNIGINPAFRINFSTVQRETYPGWPIVNAGYGGRQRPAKHDF